MALNITNGIKNATLEEMDIKTYHGSFGIQKVVSGEAYELPQALDGVFCSRIDGNAQRIFEARKIGYYSCLGEDYNKITKCVFGGNEVAVYEGPFLASFRVHNPAENGAHGLEIKGVKLHDIMLCSDMLSGCSFAILTKNEKLFVIHAGGENSGWNNDLNGLKKNADVFSMANHLAGNDLFQNLPEMDVKSMVEMLDKFGFKGFIFFNSSSVTTLIKTPNIVARSYSTQYMKCPCADVICVVNSKGKMQVAFRLFSPDTFRVKKSYQIWETTI